MAEMFLFSEYRTLFTPLGIRFWDSVLDTQVSDNLEVTAVPLIGDSLPTRAFRTPSGVYAFQGLPQLSDIESFNSDGIPPVDESEKKTFIIQVSDILNRFLPVVFSVRLPLSYNGVYLSQFSTLQASTPSINSASGFYLFSSPMRSIPPGMAVVRATIVDQNSGQPASFALMEVQIADTSFTAYGIAHKNGSIAVIFPYPSVNFPVSTSPQTYSSVMLEQQQWELKIRVKYQPSVLNYPKKSTIPDFKSIIDQSFGTLCTQWSEIPAERIYETQSSDVLNYGCECIVKTQNAGKSELRITAGTTP